MNKLLTLMITFTMVIGTPFAQAWEPDTSDNMELSVAQAIIKAKGKDPGLKKWFDTAYAYAVLPKVGKGGIGIGGASGRNLRELGLGVCSV